MGDTHKNTKALLTPTEKNSHMGKHNQTLDTLGDRVREDSNFFNSVLSYVPPRHYLDTNEDLTPFFGQKNIIEIQNESMIAENQTKSKKRKRSESLSGASKAADLSLDDLRKKLQVRIQNSKNNRENSKRAAKRQKHESKPKKSVTKSIKTNTSITSSSNTPQKTILNQSIESVSLETTEIKFGSLKFGAGKPGYSLKNMHKKKKDVKHLMNEVQHKQQLLQSLEGTEEGEKLKSEEAWAKAFKKSKGEKVKDDLKLLKKTAKREEREKRKSKKKWADRKNTEKKQQDLKQKQRQDNIKEYNDNRKARRQKRTAKKARARAGFEGQRGGKKINKK
eukprot:TRINITY_DN10702_c0_g1_i1.p1 TRINITY_DN10702_c0_g1~~TRINITY_DN10702_c0_g1_i1.p1  ORF type:complete len:335 (-),score=76.78 TRINITY_DN10702_c0_g1_i1:762-1766(-)